MYKGGTIYSPRTANVVKYAGLFIPIVLIAYGVMIQFDFIKTTHTIDNFSFFMIYFWWIAISVLQFLIPIQTRLDSGLRLVAYHLLAGVYLIFISGIASPFAVCWLLLMMGSYSFFSERGLQLSTFAFIFVIAIDITLNHNAGLTNIMYDLVALIAILVTSIITMSFTRSQEVTKEALKQSKAEESLQRDRVLTIVNNMTDAVLSVDLNGIIRVYNAASLNLLDTNDSLNGHHIDDILPLSDKDNTEFSLFKDLKAIKTVIKRDDLYYGFDDGEKIRLEITYSPIRSSYSRSKKSETHDGYIIIMRDVTKSKSLEEERDEFISVISHELRTPITIAEGTISNAQLMMDHPDITHDMLKDAINMAHDQVVFLANMVNDLSALSRAERGVSDTAEDIDVKELAHKLHDKYSESATAKGLHLDLDLSAKLDKVHVSRLYLEEILQNFITNSIKYTKTGGVKIIIKQSNGEVKFSIKDTGIGISKSDQAKIFHKFYRSEDYRTRETSGTGLGLYVAAKLAHKLGTQIDVTSRLNFGSTFTFTLPEAK